MECQLENNIVNIIGVIDSQYKFSHEVYGEGFYIFNIAAQRLSDNADILPITISERLIDKECLMLGTPISVKGQLRSYNNYTDKKNKLVLTIFAKEVEILENNDEEHSNKVYLNGFICKPPVYRTTPFGREISDVLVAVNRAYNKSDYIPCIAWGRNAKFSNSLKVGGNIKVWGRMQSRIYQKKVGDTAEERIAYEVSISRVEIVKDKEYLDDDTE